MQDERSFERSFVRYMKSIGAYITKGNSGASRGTPDRLICYKGKFIGVELKDHPNKPSELQLYHLEQIKKAGGIARVLYPDEFEEFKRSLDNE